jgi:hypothetical protein
MVICFPPDVNALASLRSLILGGGAVSEKRSAAEAAEVPAVVVTLMSNVPAERAGVKTVMDVGELTVNSAALMTMAGLPPAGGTTN